MNAEDAIQKTKAVIEQVLADDMLHDANIHWLAQQAGSDPIAVMFALTELLAVNKVGISDVNLSGLHRHLPPRAAGPLEAGPPTRELATRGGCGTKWSPNLPHRDIDLAAFQKVIEDAGVTLNHYSIGSHGEHLLYLSKVETPYILTIGPGDRTFHIFGLVPSRDGGCLLEALSALK